MKSKLLIPIFVLILLAFTANAFVISGTVTDTNTNPINNSLIQVYDSSNVLVNSTTTNATGDYSLEVGNLLRTVNCSAASYDLQSTPVFVSADTVVNFALGPIQSVTLDGYVMDNVSSPLTNADVVIAQGGATFTQTTTNAAGYYSVSVIDGNTYDVSASLATYDSSSTSVTISGNTTQNFTLTQTPTCIDNDGDGYGAGCALGTDFNDNDASQYPGASCSRTCYSGSTYDTSGACTGGSYTCGGSSCFPAGTKILMADNTNKNIEDVKVGDKVMGFNGNNQVSVEVLELESPVRDHMYTLNFEDGSELELTKEHPLYTEQGWKSLSPEETALENAELKVQELKIGDKVLNSNGNYIKIVGIDFAEKEIQTYNLKKVSEYNNFFADSYLAHNKGGSTYSGTDYTIDLDKGETMLKEVRRRDTLSFDYEGEEHTVTINNVYSSGVSVTVASDPVTETITLFQTKGFNFGGDLTNDLLITLASITGDRAELEFELKDEVEIPDLPVTQPQQPETPEPEVEDSTHQSGTGITIIVEDEIKVIEDKENTEDKESSSNDGTFFKNILDKILYLKYILAGVAILAILILIFSLVTRLNIGNKEGNDKEETLEKIKELQAQIKEMKRSL